MGFADGVLEKLGIGRRPEHQLATPDKPTVQPTPSVEDQIATHQATIQESQSRIDQMAGMDPLPQDRPLIEQEQAKIASAREALGNLQPTPPTPETPPPGIPQIPVAQPIEQPTPMPTVQAPAEEQQKAA